MRINCVPKVIGNLLTALGEGRNDDALAILSGEASGSSNVGIGTQMTPRDKVDALAISRQYC